MDPPPTWQDTITFYYNFIDKLEKRYQLDSVNKYFVAFYFYFLRIDDVAASERNYNERYKVDGRTTSPGLLRAVFPGRKAGIRGYYPALYGR